MKTSRKSDTLPARIETLILNIRGEKVILDADLARIYDVSTKALNQAVKRNIDRFPPDFLIQLKKREWMSLRSQVIASEPLANDRSQIVTSSQKHRDPRLLPYAFTEHGAITIDKLIINPECFRASFLH